MLTYLSNGFRSRFRSAIRRWQSARCCWGSCWCHWAGSSGPGGTACSCSRPQWACRGTGMTGTRIQTRPGKRDHMPAGCWPGEWRKKIFNSVSIVCNWIFYAVCQVNLPWAPCRRRNELQRGGRPSCLWFRIGGFGRTSRPSKNLNLGDESRKKPINTIQFT